MDNKYLQLWGFQVEDYRRSFNQLGLSDSQIKAVEGYIASFPNSGGLVLIGSPKIANRVSSRIIYELFTKKKFRNRVSIIDAPSFLVKATSFNSEVTEKEGQMRSNLANSDIVILQEIDLAQWTSIQQTKLYTLIYDRYSKRLPMLFTCTNGPGEIEKRIGASTFFRISDICKFLDLRGIK